MISFSQSMVTKNNARDYTRSLDADELSMRVHQFFIPKKDKPVKDQDWLREAMILRRELEDQQKFFNESLDEINNSILYEFGKNKKNKYMKESEIENMANNEKDRIIDEILCDNDLFSQVDLTFMYNESD